MGRSDFSDRNMNFNDYQGEPMANLPLVLVTNSSNIIAAANSIQDTNEQTELVAPSGIVALYLNARAELEMRVVTGEA